MYFLINSSEHENYYNPKTEFVFTIPILTERALFNDTVKSNFQLNMGNSSVMRHKIKSLNAAAKS